MVLFCARYGELPGSLNLKVYTVNINISRRSIFGIRELKVSPLRLRKEILYINLSNNSHFNKLIFYQIISYEKSALKQTIFLIETVLRGGGVMQYLNTPPSILV